jgi:sulfate/thiosulfate transport system substrate-binding protein
MRRALFLAFVLLAGSTAFSAATPANEVQLLNVSYDPTRELYKDINAAFATEWKEKTGEQVIVQQSHGGSGKQARAVIDGLQADVVTLGLGYDIDALADHGLVAQNWQTRFPHNSSPYVSTIVFLVRKGNPKGIRDWPDLLKPGIQVITPNPKTSGNGRWSYLAAWGYAYRKSGNSEQQGLAFVTELYKHVPVLDSGARGSTTTFVQRELGDVLIGWENEAYLALKEYGADKFQIVAPSESILAEPPVAIVEKVALTHGTRDLAKGYLDFLYSDEGQDIIGRNFYRPTEPKASARYLKQFAPVRLFTFQEVFGTWRATQKKHFDDGGIFDQITVH